METATAVVVTPEKSNRRRNTIDTNNDKKQQHNRCFSSSCLLYILFGICLFLWIVLQISMAKIHFKQISHDDTISQYNSTTQDMSNDNFEQLSTSFSEHMTLLYALFVNGIHMSISFICNQLKIIIPRVFRLLRGIGCVNNVNSSSRHLLRGEVVEGI